MFLSRQQHRVGQRPGEPAGNQFRTHRALNRLSSGFRINYSGDDAAGLAVANAYRSEVAVLNQGIRNANDGLSNLQIKDRRSTTSPPCSTGSPPWRPRRPPARPTRPRGRR